MVPEPPVHRRSLTGQTAQQLADAYTRPTPASSGPSRSASPTRCSRWPSRRSAAADSIDDQAGRGRAISTTEARHRRRRRWTGPRARCPNVAKTPLVGGQWRHRARRLPVRPGDRQQHAGTRTSPPAGTVEPLAPDDRARCWRSPGVGKRFGGLTVAGRRLVLPGRRREALGVVGPNGAGKTTLLNVIAGVLARRRAAGSSSTARDVTRADAAAALPRPASGAPTRCPGPFAGMTVFENVAGRRASSGPGCAGGPRADAAFDCPGDAPGSRRQADAPAGTCGCSTASGSSWRGRWPPARGCCCSTRSPAGSPRPRCPSSSTIVRQLGREGVAVIWIEHVVHALVAVVDRLMCLAHGRGAGRRRPARRCWPTRRSARSTWARRWPGTTRGSGTSRDPAAGGRRPRRLLRPLRRRCTGFDRHRRRGRDGRGHRGQRRRQVHAAARRSPGCCVPRRGRRPARRRVADRRPGAPAGRPRASPWCPEGRRLFPSLSVEENLLVGRALGPAGPVEPGDAVYDLFPLVAERRRAARRPASPAASSRPWPSAGR